MLPWTFVSIETTPKEGVRNAHRGSLRKDAVCVRFAEVHDFGEGGEPSFLEGALQFLFQSGVPVVWIRDPWFLWDLVNVNFRRAFSFLGRLVGLRTLRILEEVTWHFAMKNARLLSPQVLMHGCELTEETHFSKCELP